MTRPMTSVLLLLAMMASQAGALCDGWQTSPEARMACCAEGVECGMHESAAATDRTGPRAQDAADPCCAASESDDSQAPRSTVILHSPALAVPLLLELPLPGTSGTHAWHAQSAESPPRRVSTHVLLSVFLV